MANFRTDLQRWTEARLRRMSRGDDLAQAIRRLIDYPHNAGFIPPSNRGAIPGGLGVALRTLYPGSPANEFLLESGFLVVPSLAVAPLTVYTTEQIDAYLSWIGTELPGYVANQYLIGVGVQSADVCSSGAQRLNYPTDPDPYLIDYPSMVYASGADITSLLGDKNRTTPALWTGLSRYLAQVLGGYGNTLSSLLNPIGWEPNHKTDGLVRLWDTVALEYLYWYVRITDADGVRAVKLEIGSDGLCPLAWLSLENAGTLDLSEADRRMMEGWIMRAFYIPEDSPGPVELLSAAEIAGVYAEGAAPVAYGWHYARQRLGATSEELAEASIVTGIDRDNLSTSHHEMKVWTVSFSLLDSAISASIASGQSGDAYLMWSNIPLFVPSVDNTNLCLAQEAQGSTLAAPASVAPVYCFYDDEGLQTLEIKNQQTVGSSAGSDWAGWVQYYCGAGGSNTAHKDDGGYAGESGGWRIGNTSTMRNMATGSGDAEVRSLNLSGGTWEPSPGGLVSSDIQQVVDTAISNMSITGPDSCGVDPSELIGEIEAFCDSFGSFSCEYVALSLRIGGSGGTYDQYEWESGSDGGVGAVIPIDNAEALYLTNGQYYAQYNNTLKRNLNNGTPSFAGYANGAKYAYDNSEHVTGVQFQMSGRNSADQETPITQWLTAFPQNVGYCQMLDMICNSSYFSFWEVGTPDGLDPTREYQMETKLVTSAGSKTVSKDYDAWSGFISGGFGSPEPCTLWPGTVVESYNSGDGWYYETPDSIIITPPLTGDTSTHAYIPIGSS